MIDGTNLRGLRLLIVEDEYTIAADMARLFEEAGVQVVGPAGTVRKALALVSSDLDAAVLDVNLGDERVFPVADALSTAEVPFVFATGYDAHIIPEIYADAPRCEKPVDMMQLAHLLGTVIRA